MVDTNRKAQWFAVTVKPRHEQVVHGILQRKGLESFLPVYTARRRWVDRYKNIRLPWFPGYVFSRFDASSRSFVLSTPGVFDIVRRGREPAQIDDEEIHALQKVANSGLAALPWPHLPIGQAVEVDGGPLAGVRGTVLDSKNCDRIILSVTTVHRSVIVDVDRGCVRLLSPRLFPSEQQRVHASLVE